MTRCLKTRTSARPRGVDVSQFADQRGPGRVGVETLLHAGDGGDVVIMKLGGRLSHVSGE